MHNDNAFDETTASAQKPEIITYYNSTKGGVDCNDQLCSNYNVGRRTKRWPLAVFFHLLNISGINVFVVHKANTDKSATHTRGRNWRQHLWKITRNVVYNYVLYQ